MYTHKFLKKNYRKNIKTLWWVKYPQTSISWHEKKCRSTTQTPRKDIENEEQEIKLKTQFLKLILKKYLV